MATKKIAKNKGIQETNTESSKSLSFILKRMERLAGAAGFQAVVFSPLKNKTLVSAQLPGSVVETTLPVLLSGLSEPWAFSYQALNSAVLGRKSENIRIEEGALIVEDNRYKAQVIGASVTTVPRAEKVDGSSCDITLNGEVQSQLKDALQAVFLHKSLAALPDITVHARFTEKKAEVIAWDKSQMASYSAKNTSGLSFSFTLPLPKAQALFKDALGEANLKISDAALSLHDGAFKMSTSLPPAEEASGVPVERVLERVAALRKASLPKEVSFEKAHLQAFMENAKAVGKATALMKFNVKGSKTKASISSDGSFVESTFPSQSKAEFEFLLDISYMQTVIGKSKDVVNLTMDDSSFIFKSDSLVYAAVLSTQPEPSKTSKKARKVEGEEEEG